MDKLVIAKHKFARLSPKKAAIVMDLVRGKPLEKAKVALAFDKTKAAKMILKVVKSAEANAINNKKLNPAELYVSEIYVAPGPMYKRVKMGAKGRIDPILKRTSHIYVGLGKASLKPRSHYVHTGKVQDPSNVKKKKTVKKDTSEVLTQKEIKVEKVKVKKPAKKGPKK